MNSLSAVVQSLQLLWNKGQGATDAQQPWSNSSPAVTLGDTTPLCA